MRKLQAPVPGFLSVQAGKLKKSKLTIAVLGVLAFFLIIGLVVAVQRLHASHQIADKIDNLSKPNIGCKQVVAALGDISDYSRYSVAAQKKLLEKQVFCFSDQMMIDKAIASAKKLQSIYTSEKDTVNQKRIAEQLQDMESARAVLGGT